MIIPQTKNEVDAFEPPQNTQFWKNATLTAVNRNALGKALNSI